MSQDDQNRPGPPGGPAGAAVPVCYRHGDRETYIRCSRCDRSICPECMVSAAVGFQCPECLKEGRASVREPKTVLGGRVSAQAQAGQVSKALIAVNVLVFLLIQFAGPETRGRILTDYALIGFGGSAEGTIGVADGEWYRLLTATFLHQMTFHLFANMLALWFLGPPLEALLGRLRFAALYLLSALGGSAASYAISDPNGFSIGASGAVFGLIGAMLVIGRKLQYDLRMFVMVLAFNVVIGFLPGLNIDWRAHFGGLVVGLFLGFAFAYAPHARRNLLHLLACLAVVVAVVVTVAATTAALVG
jgi:membrane associated rhomboid family serine protease